MYQEKTDKCHLSFQFQPEWYITYSPNHWSNENTMKDYVLKILVSHITEKRKKTEVMQWPSCFGDIWHVQRTMYASNNRPFTTKQCWQSVCSSKLHRPATNKTGQEIYVWPVPKMVCQTDSKQVQDNPVDLRLSIVKPLSAKWFVQLSEFETISRHYQEWF